MRKPWKVWQRRWKESWLAQPGTAAAARGARFDMLVFDHGLLRKMWRNFHRIDEGVWRGNQPDPAMVRRLAAQGFRTILNLRGETEWGSYILEREACAAAGIRLIDMKLNSRELPSRETIFALDEIFAGAGRKLLFHCKSGSDRAGFVAALYLLLRREASIEAAQAELNWRYLHLRRGGTGVLSFMLARYGADVAKRPMTFREWVAQVYDPEALMAEFRAGAVAGFVTDRLLGRE